jgi:lysine-ketoglutarate reductase/saccharopine dehydrogenase-like protein (TIGR00300 family)
VATTERIEMRGHVLDDGTLPRVLNEILGGSADYVIERFEVGKHAEDPSSVRIAITAPDDETLQEVLNRLQQFGANLADPGEPLLVAVDVAGSFPEGFYSSTNLETEVFLDGRWRQVPNPEMDCGIVIVDGVPITKPMSDAELGDQVIVGTAGVRVRLEPRTMNSDESTFEFMNSVVSSEKPQALQVRNIAADFRQTKQEGKKILWVGGPAIVHTGSGPAMVALIEAGYVDVLFAGNALATHDIESNMYGTSLGVDLNNAAGVEHGHENHLRAINRIRREGSIKAAVDNGVITGGIMHAMVRADKQFVLVGSVRDDGPLPDVHTDVIEGQKAMRAAIDGVGYSIMVATMLHAIATGNLLPASIPLVCVDINPATVTKLSDRGSAQAVGVVTDIGLFLEQLATELVPGYRSG